MTRGPSKIQEERHHRSALLPDSGAALNCESLLSHRMYRLLGSNGVTAKRQLRVLIAA
jgi:hypothetical protein